MHFWNNIVIKNDLSEQHMNQMHSNAVITPCNLSRYYIQYYIRYYIRYYIPRPDGLAKGCLLWGFGEKMTVLLWHRAAYLLDVLMSQCALWAVINSNLWANQYWITRWTHLFILTYIFNTLSIYIFNCNVVLNSNVLLRNHTFTILVVYPGM